MDATETATPEVLAKSILDAARRIADEEIVKLIEQRIIPGERRLQELELEVTKLRR